MRWMKIDDACRYAGGLSRKTLYAAVRAGRLRAAHVGAGRNLLFCAAWIDAWLQQSVVDAERRSVASAVLDGPQRAVQV